MSTEPKEPSQWEDMLKAECNRYVNGQCSVRACLVRGGYVSGQQTVDYGVATCAFHEAIQACAERDAEIAELCESCQEQTAISDGFAESIRAKDVELVARRKRIDSLEQAENEWRDALTNRDAEIVKLQGWKISALKVMPDFQAIGALLGMSLGEDVSSNIIPCITRLQ